MRLLILFLLILTTIPLFSQVDEDIYVPKKKDTVCFHYKFQPGDTITYRLTAQDSIVIDFGTPLLKTRYELIRIVCDSVSENGHYFISQELVNYIGEESRGDMTGIQRTDSPWTGRKVWFEIDSVGKRYSIGVDDTLKAAMSPGGPFQPNLIFPFKNDCKVIDESWSYSSEIELPENGFPVPVVNQNTLFRAMKPKDTLRYECNRFQYIRTAQGAVALLTEDTKIRTKTVNTSHGMVFFHKEHSIPVHYHANIEQKLTIETPDSGIRPGFHFTIIDYTLDQYIPAEKHKEK